MTEISTVQPHLDDDDNSITMEALVVDRSELALLKRRTLDISAYTVTSELEDGSSVHTTVTAYWSFGDSYGENSFVGAFDDDEDEAEWTPAYTSTTRSEKVEKVVNHISSTSENGKCRFSLPTSDGSSRNLVDEESVRMFGDQEESKKGKQSDQEICEKNVISYGEVHSVEESNEKDEVRRKEIAARKKDGKSQNTRTFLMETQEKRKETDKKTKETRDAKEKTNSGQRNSAEIPTTSFDPSFRSLGWDDQAIDEELPKGDEALQIPVISKPIMGKLVSPDSGAWEEFVFQA